MAGAVEVNEVSDNKCHILIFTDGDSAARHKWLIAIPRFLPPPSRLPAVLTKPGTPSCNDLVRVPRGKMRLTADVVQPRSGGRYGGWGEFV